MCTVTKATAIQFIDGKCHIMKWESRTTALSGYYACISCDLLLMASGVDTQTDTHIPMHGQKQYQETRRMWPSAACTWFNNLINN